MSGITPAHAGKRQSLTGRSCARKDHPRTCGEKPRIFQRGHSIRGSPPHMRGKVWNRRQERAPRRITPAHAGKSIRAHNQAAVAGDHPRTCGEKTTRPPPRRTRRGSPPHMRGKDPFLLVAVEEVGITPAHAGKRGRHSRRNRLPWDHPRTCGEKPVIRVQLATLQGSPPHMRGKAPTRSRLPTPAGITPAHAGKRLNPPGKIGVFPTPAISFHSVWKR